VFALEIQVVYEIVGGVVIVGGSLLLVLLAILLVRRLVPHQTMARHNDVAGVIFAIMGVTYAVVLALIIFALWEKHAETRHILDREANSVGSFRVPPEVMESGLFQFGPPAAPAATPPL